MNVRDDDAIASACELATELVHRLNDAIPAGHDGDCYETRFLRAQALLLRDLLGDVTGKRRRTDDAHAVLAPPAQLESVET